MKPLRVLIVEDSPRDAELLLRELRKAGYAPFHRRVERARELADALESGEWDIVLSDYIMPEFGGPAAIRLVREKAPDLPLIILSGQIGEDTAVEAMRTGAQDYITKDNLKRLGPAIERELAEAENRRQRRKVEEELEQYHSNLERIIKRRTAELSRANQELEKALAKHRKMEQELRRAQAESAALVKYAPSGIFEFDYSIPAFLSVNDAMCEVSGYAREELMKADLETFLDSESRQLFAERLGRQLAGEPIDESVEYHVRKKDGSTLYVTFDIAPSRERPNTALVIAHDVTERRQAEARMKDIADKYSSLFDNTSDGVLLHDIEGRIIEVNNAYCAMSGYTRGELLDMRVDQLEASSTPEEVAGRIGKAAALNGHDRFESRHRRRDGSIFDADITSLYLGEARGQIALFVRDITERKKAEKLKDEFINMVSHELRTPLTVFMGSVRVARSKGISPGELNELLEEAAQSSENLSHILDNLIELSRYQSDRLNLDKTRTNIKTIVEDIIKLESDQLSRHMVTLDIAEGLPDIQVDELRLRQILRNLLSNAAKYSPAGTEITVAAERRDNEVVIGVTDRGPGISVEDQGRLFEPFERLREKSTTSAGLGLGLLVSKRLVEAHRGRIWVESTPGKGSTFRFALPLGA